MQPSAIPSLEEGDTTQHAPFPPLLYPQLQTCKVLRMIRIAFTGLGYWGLLRGTAGVGATGRLHNFPG